MDICPALKLSGNEFICEYAGKPIDPFDWHCIDSYPTCPIYAERQKPAAEPAVERRSELEQGPQRPSVKPFIIVEKLTDEGTTRPAEGPKEPIGGSTKTVEDVMKSAMVDIVRKYEEWIKRLDEFWRSYEAAVLDYRGRWEVDELRIRRSLNLLSSSISSYERALKELELKKELMPEGQYDEAEQEIRLELGVLRTAFDLLNKSYNAVEEAMNGHLKRIATTSTSAEAMNLNALSRLDDLLREGKISREVHERLKRVLEAAMSLSRRMSQNIPA